MAYYPRNPRHSIAAFDKNSINNFEFFSSLFTGEHDEQYCGTYKQYKQAGKAVWSWVEFEAGRNFEPVHIEAIAFYGALARRLANHGVKMPEGIKQLLEQAIRGRKYTIEMHKIIKQNHDEQHEHPLEVLECIRDAFFPTPKQAVSMPNLRNTDWQSTNWREPPQQQPEPERQYKPEERRRSTGYLAPTRYDKIRNKDSWR